MDWRDRIETNPEVLGGKPVVKGTRLAVEFVLELLAQGWTIDDIEGQFPALTSDAIQACLYHARAVLKSERVYPPMRGPDS